MSVDAGTEVDVWALVGEMPDQPCESAHHDDPDKTFHDDGPATHYVQMMHECWIGVGAIYTACQKSADTITRMMGERVFCGSCRVVTPPGEWIRVVGPIEGTP